jgi:hypothetical protein
LSEIWNPKSEIRLFTDNRQPATDNRLGAFLREAQKPGFPLQVLALRAAGFPLLSLARTANSRRLAMLASRKR